VVPRVRAVCLSSSLRPDDDPDHAPSDARRDGRLGGGRSGRRAPGEPERSKLPGDVRPRTCDGTASPSGCSPVASRGFFYPRRPSTPQIALGLGLPIAPSASLGYASPRGRAGAMGFGRGRRDRRGDPLRGRPRPSRVPRPTLEHARDRRAATRRDPVTIGGHPVISPEGQGSLRAPGQNGPRVTSGGPPELRARAHAGSPARTADSRPEG
jgi:hypothetical protein